MSLSGQYLEELSRRYRKQVEELQQSHAKTLHDIEEQTRRMHDSEVLLREENERLRAEFVSFRDSILSWKNITMGLIGFAVVNIVVVCALVRSCGGGGGNVRGETERDSIDRELAQVSTSGKPIKERLLRRKSIDGVVGGSSHSLGGSLKKKRPSEEALNITGTYENLLIDEGGGDCLKVERKKGRHKHRKISAPSMTPQQPSQINGKSKRATSVEPPVKAVMKTELMRTESAPEPRKPTPETVTIPDDTNRIDEIPFLEDNDEFIIPTASDLSYNEFVPDSTSETNKTNGMLSSSSSIDSKSTGKSGKGRRLSSPAFFKSSLLRSSISRKSSGKKSSASQNVSSASSNTSSGSSNVRISINVHSPSASASVVSDDGSPHVVDGTTPAPNHNNNNSQPTSNGSWEWYKLKKSSSQDKFTKRKSKSESPDPETMVTTAHNNGSASFNGSAEKKLAGGGPNGSFRRLFRKVF